MGTRGTYGLRKNGKDKKTYNHWDSYPEGLGVALVEQINEMDLERLNTLFDNLEMVKSNDKPTKKQIEQCQRTTDLSVSNQSVDDFYCLLRNTQGDLKEHEAVGLMIENDDFIYDSLFCEWGYIINLDDNVLEIYEGFQKSPHSDGRYSSGEIEDGSGYYQCALVKTYPLDNLPTREELVAFEEERREAYDSE